MNINDIVKATAAQTELSAGDAKLRLTSEAGVVHLSNQGDKTNTVTISDDKLGLNADVTVASGKKLTLTKGNATLTEGNLTLTKGNATLTEGNLTLTEGELEVGGINLLNPEFPTGMAVDTVATAATRIYAVDTITINNYTGANQQIVTLPAATIGKRVTHLQSVDTAGVGANPLIFDCAGTDKIRTGTKIISSTAANIQMDTSDAGETRLVFTPANATTNFFSKGSQIHFICRTKGLWDIALDNSKCLNNTATAITGTFAFAA